MPSPTRQFLTNLFPHFWRGIIEREKIRNQHQNIQEALNQRDVAIIEFSECQPAYLFWALGKRHNNIINQIKSKGIELGEGEYKIPNREWKTEIIDKTKRLSFYIMLFNLLTMAAWILIIFSLAVMIGGLMEPLIDLITELISISE